MASVVILFTSSSFNRTESGKEERPSVIHLPGRDEISLKYAPEGKFSVLTYNIAGLPEFISSAVTSRAESIADIGRRVNRYDIVHVQEDFNYNDQLYNSGNRHAYRSLTMGPVPFGDGLNTLSKYPVSEVKRISWNDCTDADCLTPKGFSYSRIEVAQGVYIDFYNVHANAANHQRAAAARCKNIKQFSDYIRAHSDSNAVIVMGDLNAHYSYYYDNVKELLDDNGLRDAWLVLRRKGKFPGRDKTLPDDNILKLTDTCESIDKVLFRGSRRVRLQPLAYHLERDLFTDEIHRPLSDHCPVSVSFAWFLKF